jgi:hypothetical protein
MICPDVVSGNKLIRIVANKSKTSHEGKKAFLKVVAIVVVG